MEKNTKKPQGTTKPKASKNVWEALAKFQSECPAIAQKTANHRYKYADLKTIMEVIQPILHKNDLVMIQPMRIDRTLETVVMHHPSETSVCSHTDIPADVILAGMNQYQSDGAAITYYRRYILSSLLGIVTEEDTDAAGKQKPKAPKVRTVVVGTALFENCCKGYRDGTDREEMESKNLKISDEVWAEIENCAQS